MARVKRKMTVYYKHGRRTLEHTRAANVGWHDSKVDWVFFGNVVEKWLNEDYWSIRDNESDPKKERKNLLLAVRLLQTAAQEHRAPLAKLDHGNHRMCTSYFNPMTKLWEKDKHESKFGQQKVKLLEIFWRAVRMTSHPSRNRFRWVDSDDLKSVLHELASKARPEPRSRAAGRR